MIDDNGNVFKWPNSAPSVPTPSGTSGNIDFTIKDLYTEINLATTGNATCRLYDDPETPDGAIVVVENVATGTETLAFGGDCVFPTHTNVAGKTTCFAFRYSKTKGKFRPFGEKKQID